VSEQAEEVLASQQDWRIRAKDINELMVKSSLLSPEDQDAKRRRYKIIYV
jgi:hypothetical protein